MSGHLCLQLYLLAKMRARSRIDEALLSLGAHRNMLETAVTQAQAYDLEQPGHPMETYTRLIGAPAASRRIDTADPYRQVVYNYRLPLWPTLFFSVYGNREGQTGGVSFIAMSNTVAPITDPTALRPWEIVEDQIAPLSNARVVEDWYPQRDYEMQFRSSGTGDPTRYVLRFDFQLLQEVVPA